MKWPVWINALWIGTGAIVLLVVPIVSIGEPAFRPYKFETAAGVFAAAVAVTAGFNKFSFGRYFPQAGTGSIHEQLVRKCGRFRTLFFYALVAFLSLYPVVKELVVLIAR